MGKKRPDKIDDDALELEEGLSSLMHKYIGDDGERYLWGKKGGAGRGALEQIGDDLLTIIERINGENKEKKMEAEIEGLSLPERYSPDSRLANHEIEELEHGFMEFFWNRVGGLSEGLAEGEEKGAVQDALNMACCNFTELVDYVRARMRRNETAY